MEAIHKMNLNELKDLGIIAAKRAGDLLNKNKEKEKKVFQELGKDIKLQLDRDTENLIREELKPSGIQILGEE
jgi:fructose-1,6-bisphosphatase/inositol monophosphatase family enzyme